MAEQTTGGGSFIKAFLPGLAIGLAVGGFAGAFLAPMIGSPPEPISPVRSGAPLVLPPANTGFDERAPRPAEPTDAEKKADPAADPAKDIPPIDPPKPIEPKPADPAPKADPK